MDIRWRDKDPAEQGDSWRPGRDNWTRVHVSRDSHHDSDATTVCGLKIPDSPYMSEMDGEIPSGAARCKRCERVMTS